MNNYYFTFGTSEKFPFGIDEYVVVYASSIINAEKVFMEKYPSDNPLFVNCAFVYEENEWITIKEKYYKDILPSMILSTENWEKKVFVKVDWNIDDIDEVDDFEELGLPEYILTPFAKIDFILNSKFDKEKMTESISNYLSENYGYCINSFEILKYEIG